uniref:Putative activating signal cointegrator 1 n=1 Tax=Davidia involucrata TaxID=16924 RepID=A0A5B6YN00_DAVIN
MESPGQWLEKALLDLCKKMETGLDLDGDLISGLVSYCELASPLDAKEYLDNIIGQEAGKSVIEEYLKQRGHSDICNTTSDASSSKLLAYVKPPSDEGLGSATKKSFRALKEVTPSGNQANRVPTETVESRNMHKGNQGSSKKKKAGKVVSLAEAAKGSIIFQQGKPCSCQARRHGLVSNCLSCGKIVCEQEGEGPCSFCGALVLREGSTYAGLEEGAIALSDAEAAAEAYAKRLVEYDRDSAARTTVIDDQSDYYEIEGNSWLSMEEKELLRKKKEEIEEAERAKRSKVIMTFDLVGRKVLMNEDEVSELEMENRILRPPDEREANRIKPNPTLKVQPIFMDPGTSRKPVKGNHLNKGLSRGLCLEISGRVQHDTNELKRFMTDNQLETASDGILWHKPTVNDSLHVEDDAGCSIDYH